VGEKMNTVNYHFNLDGKLNTAKPGDVAHFVVTRSYMMERKTCKVKCAVCGELTHWRAKGSKRIYLCSLNCMYSSSSIHIEGNVRDILWRFTTFAGGKV
jgi:hypothetical protein